MITMRPAKLIAALLLLILMSPVSSIASTMLVWGDSLSAAYSMRVEQGWVALLQTRINNESSEAWNVVNASISGETASGGLTRLPAALAQHRPDILILGLGSNDGLRGQPLRQLENHLRQMVELAKARDTRVLLIGNRIPPNYGARYTDGFAQVFTDVSSSEDVPMVPFLLEGVATDFDLMQADGLHPTPEAQPRLLDNVWPHLEPLL